VTGPMDGGRLRARVAAGEGTLGTFVGTASPISAEVCAAAGFDYLLLDLEHGAGGEEQVRATVPVVAAYGVPTVVRVETDARMRIGRVLDAGAAGVMLPRMETAEQVRAAMMHLYYPPRGDRGVATYNRACRFGLDPDALDRANDEILGIVQIESGRAVIAAAEIAAVEGVDVLFVGPRDLPRPGRSGPDHGAGLRRRPGAGPTRRPQAREGLRTARPGRRGGRDEAGGGLDIRHHRLRLHPPRHCRDSPSFAGARARLRPSATTSMVARSMTGGPAQGRGGASRPCHCRRRAER